MSITRKHTLYGLSVGSTLIGGVTSQQVRTGTTVDGSRSSGDPWARFQSITAQQPGAMVTTRAIAAALAAVGLSGADIGGITGGVGCYAQKHAAGGTRAGTLSHRKYTFNDGLIVPRRLTVEGQGHATLELDVVSIYDGSNDPVVIADSVSLPSGLADDERFALGPVEVESVTIGQVRSLEIDFGLEVVAEADGADVWPTFVSIESWQPSITLRGIDQEWFKAANIPLAGKNATHANTEIYLRKRAAGGTFVADATAEHIKFTAAGMATINDAMNASAEGGAAESTLTLQCRYDGTNNPLTIDTTNALP